MNNEIDALVDTVLGAVHGDSDTERANTMRELADALVKRAITMGSRNLEALADLIIENMPAKVELIYVSQGDKLTDEQVALLVAGNHEKLWESLDEWESESRWYGTQQFVDEAVKDVIKGWEQEDAVDYGEVAEEFNGSDAFDRVRDELWQREDGDWFKSLMRGCSDVLLRISVIDEDAAFSFQPVTPEEVLAKVGLAPTEANVKTVQYALDNASPEYSVIMGYWIVGADVEEINELDKAGATEVEITNPYLYLGSPFQGSGFITEEPLEGTVRVRREDLRTDKGAFGYAVSEVYGGLDGSQFSATITPVSPPTPVSAEVVVT